MTILFRDDDDDEINYSQRGRITIFHTYVFEIDLESGLYLLSCAEARPPLRGDSEPKMQGVCLESFDASCFLSRSCFK